MSRLNDLIRQVARSDEVLAADLQREVAALADRRSFGLNFERHVPEAVELPGRPVRRGDKVRILPPRGEKHSGADGRLWRVTSTSGGDADVEVVPLDDESDDLRTTVACEDVVVVAEFRDPIYPGLVSTGTVERGGDKPFHTVVNAENYLVLQALLFTNRGKVDAIYIDPPYNTGARDWKYNNDYVDTKDIWRHSRWLSFMEKRLHLAKSLLKADGVLIVTIDHNEQHRLNMLIEEVFPSHEVTTVVIQHNPRGIQGDNFSWTHEYALFVTPNGRKVVAEVALEEPDLSNFRNWGGQSLRTDARNCFYPVFVDPDKEAIIGFGDVMPDGDHPSSANEEQADGSNAVWPIDGDGVERKWRYARQTVDAIQGRLSVKPGRGGVLGIQIAKTTGPIKTVWTGGRFDASVYGSQVLTALIPGRKFDYPKSLYAVLDCLSAVVQDKPNALILDFFGGSGTTLHATALMNAADGGERRCIVVTNNEVSVDEQRALRKGGGRPGDPDWEALGICDHITVPRITAALTGKTPNGDPVNGVYKIAGEPSLADGLLENVEFFTLTYEAPLQVASHRAFERIAPLLWLRAGARGGRIDDVSDGWDVAETYGVLADLDSAGPFVEAVAGAPGLQLAFIVTDEDRLFEAVVRELPDHVEPVRLYESYLRTFELSTGGSTR